MGSGKSTIGKLLAKKADFHFCDTDQLVEKLHSMTIPDIFKTFGEEAFRSSETNVLRDLSLSENLVVSTGGGAILRPDNWKHLKTGCVCWLDGSPELLARRVERDGYDKRPLLANKVITDREELLKATIRKIQDIFEKRRALYEQAHVRVPVATAVEQIIYNTQGAESATPEQILIRLLTAILENNNL
nr:shikimate kinase (SK), chloroplastic [Polytomella parva]|eukprot:CAMPEP_0175040126 /NCGR_PEP_ID=MMETSP0052_2-20121109/1061_1 /TAXON_ID=51329 ORGANISM="Polytomella parva, Strain SAG 63-3" /NCGR_SAMPLE_ID=MMETSP0052_2 /ASSEMBLY_ACC=CAM_ASM_000194 /LENGTH=187 /DNA_ID=CAMNT_0016302245 /DNA_START=261 /DNA_END=824 /DNA_ORIENTATION=-